jgi:EAL domain-containing protein (putative c-di-GMP-specific phosphodiesterase class I)
MTRQTLACEHCADRKGRAFAHQITMAFQPIFDLGTGRVFAQEALLRGVDGRGAGEMLGLVDDDSLYNFDQTCRVTAIQLAARLGLADSLSINFMPNAVYEPSACIRRTLWAADACNFPVERIIFEFTEVERVRDKAHLKDIVTSYKAMGFRTAIDDFGAGYSGLTLIADVVPDIVKLDRELLSGIDRDPTRRTIVAALQGMCRDLGIRVVAEGIETAGELSALRDLGITLVQGFLLARPRFEALQTEADVPL